MKSRQNQNGFTLLELLVVVAIAAIIAAAAIPSYMESRKGAKFREAARSISSSLREARSNAITQNLEYQVVFSMANSTYAIQRGNNSSGSTAWSTVLQGNVQPGVRLSAPDACTDTTASANRSIQFNPNGTANPLYICVMDGNTMKFKVGVTSSTTGRVQITQ